MIDIAQNYKEDLKLALDNLPCEKVTNLAEKIYKTIRNNSTIFLFGNGGSAATASHITCDLQKSSLMKNYKNTKRVKAICLNDNIPLITAWANDYGYEHIFEQQLLNTAKKGDLVIAITGSGNSPNIVNALKVANTQKLDVFSLLGFDGGKAKKLSEDYIIVKSESYGVIEDVHMVIGHMLTEILKTKLN